MTDSLRLTGGDRDIDLYPWLSSKVKGHEALAGIVGFGLPDITNQWFDGAGSGSTYRGSRINRRVIDIPMEVYAEDRIDLNTQLSDLAVALDPFLIDPDTGLPQQSRLLFGMPDDWEWYVDVVRAAGGDWARKVDSDDRTFFRTKLKLEAGDPFWTRTEPESFRVDRSAITDTLLPRFAKLRVASSSAYGTREVTNVGDTYAWPVFTVFGPTTEVQLIGANGELLKWTGTLLAGQTLTIDMRNNTVEDQAGVNRYDGLATAPQFWSIAPGTSTVQVSAASSTSATAVLAQWRPRRWAVV